ncbi:MAG: RHS repeat-associated core domain-containing protein, partial [Candidatus Obscuribacterales bacterium]|nr:RHS repeat-associated core domain-containing protein [Candidatus Obscuribacterales bacterium]
AGVTVNFVYDPFHRNIRKDDGTNKTRYIYSGDHIVAEYNDTSGALINRYVYGFEADDPIIQVTAAGVVTYNSQDHIGSIIARTDSSGNALSKYKYSPFGESPTGSLSGTIFGFTGQRFDSEIGLYHFKARYYDPVTGRFLQPDSIGYGAGLNLYRYAKNSPLILRDPTGNYEEVPVMQNRRDYIPVLQEIGEFSVGALNEFRGEGLPEAKLASTSPAYQLGQGTAWVSKFAAVRDVSSRFLSHMFKNGAVPKASQIVSQAKIRDFKIVAQNKDKIRMENHNMRIDIKQASTRTPGSDYPRIGIR